MNNPKVGEVWEAIPEKIGEFVYEDEHKVVIKKVDFRIITFINMRGKTVRLELPVFQAYWEKVKD